MSKPAYELLYEKIRREILSGSYPPGSKLPGKRSLAEQNGVSVITVEHALELLSEEGYVALKERSGCYVIYHETDTLPEKVNLPAVPMFTGYRSSADMDGFPFSVLARTMRRVLSDQGAHLLEKSPNQGILFLRQALSRYLSRSRGISAAPEQIVIGAGAEYLYGLLTEMLPKGRIWAIESPSYEKIEQVYSSRGIALDPLPLGQDGLVSEQLWRTEASILHVSPYRSYPSDVSASASKRSEYLRWGEQPERMIIEDDYESEFSVRRKPMEPLFAQSSRGNVIYLNTFSRTISSALRVGYMVIPSSLLPLYRSRVGFYSCTVPAFEQYVLSYLIDSGDFERHIRRVRRKLRASVGGPDQRA